MSDFSQDGLICTLQYLCATNSAELEARLHEQAQATTIVLPCHAADLAGGAFENILAEIARAPFLGEVIVTTNGLDENGFRRALGLVQTLPQPYRVLWNDGPRLLRIWAAKRAPVRAGFISGKGFNLWAAIGLVYAESPAGIIVTQDCDVLSFRKEMSLRLCSAVIDPNMNYYFAKAYYSRVKDRIYGRASRLFLAPLLRALLRVVGHHPLLDFLLSFRYPLSGEWAMTTALLASLPVRGDWGLEIGLLCELFRRTDPRKISQVDPGGEYDHKHQPLHDGKGGGLARMTAEIARTLLFHLSQEGVGIDASFMEAVRINYSKEAQWALKRYKSLARINSLSFDEAGEREAVEAFARFLPGSEDRSDVCLPSWKTMEATLPDFAQELRSAVDADQRLGAL